MSARRLKPGEHGEIFVYRTGTKWRAKVRVRLLDGDDTQVSRTRDSAVEARLAVQAAIVERLGAARGSAELRPDSKVGLACRQWVNEMRARTAWPNPPVLPQTVDEYERVLGNHVVPHLGKRRLNELTPAACQQWLDGVLARGRAGGKHDMLATAIQARAALVAALDRAVIHDALRDNPARKTIAPAKKRPEPVAMSPTRRVRLRGYRAIANLRPIWSGKVVGGVRAPRPACGRRCQTRGDRGGLARPCMARAVGAPVGSAQPRCDLAELPRPWLSPSGLHEHGCHLGS